MKQLLLLFLIILFSGCEEKPKNTNDKVTKTGQESKYKNLLSQFKTISIDTLEVYSSEDYGKYKGIKIDSTDAVLFPKEIAEAYFIEPDIYACYKFDINPSRIGLIARTPSMYVPSSIKLFVYNKIDDTISEYIELAESWGDAGDSLEKTSWLIKNKDNGINTLIRTVEKHDHSVDSENDTIVDRWEKYYLIELAKPTLDTIHNSALLKNKFHKILNNKASH